MDKCLQLRYQCMVRGLQLLVSVFPDFRDNGLFEMLEILVTLGALFLMLYILVL